LRRTEGSRRVKIVVVGSIAIDSIKSPYGSADSIPGGSATYFSIAASYLCNEIGVVAAVGTDFPYMDLFHARGIDTSGMEIIEGKTFRWGGRYEEDNPNLAITEYTSLNVFQGFRPNLPNPYRDAEYLFLANIDPSLQKDVLAQMKMPKIVGLDTMDFWIERKRDELFELFDMVDMIFLNEEEAKRITGEKSTIKALRAIEGNRAIVVKRGEYGSITSFKGTIFCLPAYPVEMAVDPTGAGDSFAGGVIGYIASIGGGMEGIRESEMKRAVAYGTIMASFCIESFGPKRLMEISREDIKRRLEEFEDMISLRRNP
jgi:sugar/nucleoside kinase (ribokinase family)